MTILQAPHMEKQIAAELMDEIVKMAAQLNVIMHRAEVLLRDDELLATRRHLTTVMVAFDQHLFRPIVKQYPDLDPHM